MTLSLRHCGVGLALILSLTGCSGLQRLESAATPSELYALTPKSTFSSDLPNLSQQLVVEVPTATAAVNTDQIAVQPSALRVQYLPGARWVDRVPLFVQALLIESFENSNRVPAVGGSGIGLRADYFITSNIREFQASLPANATAETPLRIQVQISVKIVDADVDRIFASRSFNEYATAASDAAADVAAAFDEALGDVMRDAVEWSIRSIHSYASEKERQAVQDRRPEPRPSPLDAPAAAPEPAPAPETAQDSDS